MEDGHTRLTPVLLQKETKLMHAQYKWEGTRACKDTLWYIP